VKHLITHRQRACDPTPAAIGTAMRNRGKHPFENPSIGRAAVEIVDYRKSSHM